MSARGKDNGTGEAGRQAPAGAGTTRQWLTEGHYKTGSMLAEGVTNVRSAPSFSLSDAKRRQPAVARRAPRPA